MKKDTELHFEESVFGGRSGEYGYLELPLSRTPFLLIGILGVLFAGVVLARLGFLTIVNGKAYEERSFSNIHREILVPAPRGKILDVSGVVLASEEPTFSVVLQLGDLFRSGDIPGIAEKLAETLDIPKNDIVGVIERANPETQSSVLLVRGIDVNQAIVLKSASITGVQVEDGFRRIYPEGKAFSHVLGYVSPFPDENGRFGRLGIEARYEETLEGEDGREIYLEDVEGKILGEKETTRGTPGNTLQLTLDAELGHYMYDRLLQGLRDVGRTSGVVIALEPQTGKVLGLVSVPSFDNTLFSYFGSKEEKQRILSSSDSPLFNRPVSGLYNPGSTIKPLMALAALKEKIVSPTYQIFSPGYIEIPNPYFPDHPSRFLDWKPHGWVDVRSALARSSNVYFYEVGGGFEGLHGLGIARINRYWRELLFDEKTGIDIPGEKISFLPDPDEKLKRTGTPWLVGDTYNVSIGQGDFSTTPIRLLSFFASIANGGIFYQPFVVEKILDPKGAVIEERGPMVIFDYSSWSKELYEVQEGLKDTVRMPYGSAYSLHDIPMSIALKTGTAQIESNTKINAFSVGYAPTEDPKIALLVLVENAKEGSINTLPVARDIFLWYYKHRIAVGSTR